MDRIKIPYGNGGVSLFLQTAAYSTYPSDTCSCRRVYTQYRYPFLKRISNLEIFKSLNQLNNEEKTLYRHDDYLYNGSWLR